MFMRLACKSLLNRRGSVVLTVLALTVSLVVLLGVEHIRQQARDSFGNTVSGVDLIVGARTGSLNLLLYSVFHMGSPTNNISWDSYQKIASGKHVAWAVPIALGDSYRGYRVMGSTPDYFTHFSYGGKRKLQFTSGKAFAEVLDVVLGSEVAKKLSHKLGDQVVLAHGIASTSFSLHDDKPFNVVGILAPTGTPVDQTVHVSLQGIEAIHIDWQQGVKMPGNTVSTEQLAKMDLQPANITAFMLGLNSKIATFRVQREINNYSREPLTAILPGVALSELWQMMATFEHTLRLISACILVSALLGLSAMLLASIREREHEIQLLRVIGAPPMFLFLLIELEALLISFAAIALGSSLLYMVLVVAGDLLASEFGLHISTNIGSESTAYIMLLMIFSTVIAAAIPSLKAYKNARRK
ncbi:peptide ABC transporter permease [Gammaproteobacteria bacterium 50_400_T64]|nr:peptide ABC transporter permease [Gammaproteobacteria bacterium 50_400_T64]